MKDENGINLLVTSGPSWLWQHLYAKGIFFLNLIKRTIVHFQEMNMWAMPLHPGECVREQPALYEICFKGIKMFILNWIPCTVCHLSLCQLSFLLKQRKGESSKKSKYIKEKSHWLYISFYFPVRIHGVLDISERVGTAWQWRSVARQWIDTWQSFSGKRHRLQKVAPHE